MKARFTSTLALLTVCFGSAHAQYPAFPDSNAYWLMAYEEQAVFQYFYGYHLRSPMHDTLIGGLSYSSLWTGSQGQATVFAGGLRADPDNRVYYFHPNSSTEYLLYDFDPNVGDSMHVWVGDYFVPSNPLVQMHIASIEVLTNSNGTAYKRIGVLSDLAISLGEPVTEYWIEGVGGTGGLLSTEGNSFTPLGRSDLVCMQYNDSIWPAGDPGLCSPMSIAENGSNGIVLFPNPNQGNFTVRLTEGSPRAKELRLLNAQGRTVPVQWRTVSSALEGTIGAHTPAGIYLLQVVFEDGTIQHGKLVLQP